MAVSQCTNSIRLHIAVVNEGTRIILLRSQVELYIRYRSSLNSYYGLDHLFTPEEVIEYIAQSLQEVQSIT